MRLPPNGISYWKLGPDGSSIYRDGYIGVETDSPKGLIGLKNPDTYIDVDSSGNIVFSDPISGTQTLSSLIGGGNGGSGNDITEHQHYEQLSSAIQTIIKDLDGYVTLNEIPSSQNLAATNDAIQTILKDLDGYQSRLGFANVKDYGAKGDGATDDTAAINSAIAAAFPPSRSSLILYFPPGLYKISSTIEIGNAAGTYYGVTVCGAGKTLSRIAWFGSSDDGIIKLTNASFSNVKDLQIGDSLTGHTKAQYGIWFNTEDDKSAMAYRTDELWIYDCYYGMIIGGGQILSSGQGNAGLHTGYSFTGNVAARITGANVECQTFIGFNWGITTALADAYYSMAVESLNGRGIYLRGGEIDFLYGGHSILIKATGGNLFGGGFKVEDIRIEDGYCLFYLDSQGADNGTSSPATLSAFNVVNNLNTPPTISTDPCDMVRSDYAGTVHLKQVMWPYGHSRVHIIGQAIVYSNISIENCMINHDGAEVDPGLLVYLDTYFPNIDVRGISANIIGNMIIDYHTPYNTKGYIPNVYMERTPKHGYDANYIRPIMYSGSGVEIKQKLDVNCDVFFNDQIFKIKDHNGIKQAIQIIRKDLDGYQTQLNNFEIVNVKDYGAVGNGTTDDTTAINNAISAAFPITGGDSILYFPPGNYKITSTLSIGTIAGSYNGVSVCGAGRYLSRISWFGSTDDGIIKINNSTKTIIKDLSIGSDTAGTSKAQYGLWFYAADGLASFSPRTDNLDIYNCYYGMIIGGGAILSSGQSLSGLHTGYNFTGDIAAKITGANVRSHTFEGFYWNITTALADAYYSVAVDSLNGRGIYLKDGEIKFTYGGHSIVVRTTGGNLFDGGVSLENLRINDGYCLAYITSQGADSGSSAPILVSASNISNVLTNPVTISTDPCDMVRSDYAGTIHLKQVLWPYGHSRVHISGQESGYSNITLENCLLNHDGADDDPGLLVILDTYFPNIDVRGISATIIGNMLIDYHTPYNPIAYVPNVWIRRTPKHGSDSNYIRPLMFSESGVSIQGDVSFNGEIFKIKDYNCIKDSIQTIRKDLDGYQTQISGNNLTELQHYKSVSSAIQTILKDLDGYTASGSTGATGDGYVAFFTGTSVIAGDNDLYWNRSLNRLETNQITHSSNPLNLGTSALTSHSLTAGDVLIGGSFESNGVAYFDNGSNFYTGNNNFFSKIVVADNTGLYLGHTTSSIFSFYPQNTHGASPPETQYIMPSTTRQFIFNGVANKTYDHTNPVDPTVFFQSATDPDVDNTQWLSVSHEKTGGFIRTGGGGLNIDPAGQFMNVDGYISDPTNPLTLGNTATTSHGLVIGDVLISNNLEVDGYLYVDASSANDSKWLSVYHNGSDGYVASGAGNLYLAPNDGYVYVQTDLIIKGQVCTSYSTLLEPSGTVARIDWNYGNVQTLSLASASGDVSVNFINGLVGASYMLRIIQHPSVAKNIIWPQSCYFAGGVHPIITTTASAIDAISMAYFGTYYLCNYGQDYK